MGIEPIEVYLNKSLKQMFRAKCGTCTAVFDVAAIPMEAGRWATVAAARGKYCPYCGSDKTFCAPARDFVPGELVTKLDSEVAV
jgi:hypothetical protein